MGAEVFKVRMSEMDFRLILHIKELREKKGMSQLELSQKMGLASGFVGKVEMWQNISKYNIRHLPLLAKAFGFKNAQDVLPKGLVKHDQVEITFEKEPQVKRDGTFSKNRFYYRVLGMEPVVSQKEE